MINNNFAEARTPEAQIILSKCCRHNKTFGVRVEKRDNDWVRTWAFRISEASAMREGFDRTKITGSLYAFSEFPGCPYCGDRGLFLCACGKASCFDGKSRSVFCHWCNTKAENLSHSASFDVNVGAF
jgi:hypothetical protein